jgi:hypothetical protein
MNDQSHFQGRRATLLLVAAALLGAATAHAADLTTAPPPAPACMAPAATTAAAAPAATDSTGGAGMLAFIDPQTGRLTSAPSDEQRAAMRIALAALLNESAEGLTAVQHADGRLSMDITGRFMHTATINLRPNGEPSLACTNRLEDAVMHVTTPAIPVLDGLETQ